MANAYIANSGTSGTVSVLDTTTNTFKSGSGYPISVGNNPSGVAVTPDGTTAYVVNTNSGTVSVINTATNTVSTTITVGLTPIGVAITPDGNTVYVANVNSETVSIIPTSTNAVSDHLTFGAGSSPQQLAISPDSSKLYVVLDGANEVAVINTVTLATLATLTVGSGPQGIAVTPDGTKVYVANVSTDTVSVINAKTNSVITGAGYPITVGNAPYGIAITADGTAAYVTNNTDGTVSVINTSTDTVTTTLNVGAGPTGIAISRDGTTAYVANSAADSVSPITISTNTVGTAISDGSYSPNPIGQFIQPFASSPMTSIYTALQGRLTLTMGTPVMTADVSGATAIYYDPYVGNIIPIYDGANMQSYTFGELKMTLSTTNQTNGNLYDLFVFLNSGVVTIGAGPAWSSTTSRGTGAGTTQIQQKDGLWVNANTITLTNGATSYSSIPTGEATYVGTVYMTDMTANGQTGMQFKPAAAAGGSNNFLGLYNAYNRIEISSLERDSTLDWTYATQTYVPLNNGTGSGTGNRISFVDRLKQSPITATAFVYIATSGDGELGMALNSISGTPNVFGSVGGGNSEAVTITEPFFPQLGFHYLQAIQWVDG